MQYPYPTHQRSGRDAFIKTPTPVASESQLLISTMPEEHLHDELARNPARVSVDTRYGPVVGGRASNEAVIFLGNLFISVMIPY